MEEKNKDKNKEQYDGKVTLDKTYYFGKDMYSEGSAEDELLKIVRNRPAEEYNRAIAESGSWNTLYHLSHIRGNIVDFLPLTKNDSVLEVGAGCGAITGTLAKKAGRVTCIELSAKRSLINATRNNYENIEIKIGNFMDIEKNLKEKYDYILLIGVLEYSGAYVDDDNPYDAMLERMGEHLKENGKIIIAIENKYGIKYFAGAREDHTGKFFDGIEGYRETTEVRTFSKPELEALFNRNGYEFRFMYPYPDYKLPCTLFSDDRLPGSGELNMKNLNFDGERLTLFSENKALEEAAQSGTFPMFANSFWVELKKNDNNNKKETKVIFSKHSNERRPELCIRTDITEDEDGNRSVFKYPYSEGAKQHLKQMENLYKKQCEQFEGTEFKPNVCKSVTQGDDFKGLEFEYIKGTTLAEAIDGLLDIGNQTGAEVIVQKYINILNSLATETFVVTDEFKKVFGDAKLPDGEKSLKITNIDLIFSNIIISSEWNIIDYEWSFDFPVPIKYVMYRAIFYYMREMGLDTLGDTKPYEMAGIKEEEMRIFARMESSFQHYIAGDSFSLLKLYSIFGRNNISFERAYRLSRALKRPERVKLYMDYGNGFDEENTCYVTAGLEDGDRVILDTVIPPKCVSLRIDPADYHCQIKLIKCRINGKETPIMCNGEVMGHGIVYFDTNDPQLLIENTWSGNKVHMEYEIGTIEEKYRRPVDHLVYEKREQRKSLFNKIAGRDSDPYSWIKL
ncbi:MAG: class I SAM-dependent methyltransferase [Lachnospiraceae bacterium]|nr:class I SAM-dependent methyltransferase [Lachnospiraceae bacterium]